jgi:hypothetical protein
VMRVTRCSTARLVFRSCDCGDYLPDNHKVPNVHPAPTHHRYRSNIYTGAPSSWTQLWDRRKSAMIVF